MLRKNGGIRGRAHGHAQRASTIGNDILEGKTGIIRLLLVQDITKDPIRLTKEPLEIAGHVPSDVLLVMHAIFSDIVLFFSLV